MKHEATKKELEDIHTRTGRLTAESAELAETAERERARLGEMEGVPEKIRKQAETEGNVMKGLRVQESRLLDKVGVRKPVSLDSLTYCWSYKD